jgi:hypothetical protein
MVPGVKSQTFAWLIIPNTSVVPLKAPEIMGSLRTSLKG